LNLAHWKRALVRARPETPRRLRLNGVLPRIARSGDAVRGIPVDPRTSAADSLSVGRPLFTRLGLVVVAVATIFLSTAAAASAYVARDDDRSSFGSASAVGRSLTWTGRDRPSNTAAPTISGQAQVLQTLTAAPGTWSGVLSMSFAYQWKSCDSSGSKCSQISGATSSFYTVAGADVGRTLRVTVTASNAAGTGSATSGPTSSVSGPPPTPPSNTAAPTISGQAKLQQTLTAAPGSWSGTQPISFAYQWARCDSAGAACLGIPGATGSSYTVALVDVASTLEVSVTASNSAGSASASSAATSPVASASSSTVVSKQMYWGAWIGSQLSGAEAPWDPTAIADFETMTGKGVSLINWSSSFTNCGNPCNFQTAQYESVRQHGAIPFFSWGSTGFTDAQIASGLEDSYITIWATQAKSWGHPFFLRFNWEMNASWFDWGVGKNGNTAADYVAAWRHVHDIFTSVGATNATWVWCPNIDPNNTRTPLASVYPGDAYVDWTCLDGYNWDAPWMSFDQLYGSTYQQLVAIAPGKPVAIGEISSTEAGGSKASWISDVLTTQLPTRYPQVKALLWFEKYDNGMDWPIETSSTSKAAFAAGIASSAYASNQFASLGAGPIQPLS
jgi:hypothetical protein